MIEYHDNEWGRPVVGAVDHFERLALESFQAGLSWSTILHKRPAFRVAFRGFDPAIVAAFDEDDRARLMADPGIVRNRSKIDVTIVNARLFLEIVADSGSFEAYLATIVPPPPRRLPPDAPRRRHPGHVTRLGPAVGGPLAPRVPLRGLDDHLRPHAEHRPRGRPPADVFPLRRRRS